MRSILFFDLPVEKDAQRRAYTKFVKNIKKIGFGILQKSVYIKLNMDAQSADSTKEKVKKVLPNEGSVIMLRVTEKRFASMDFLVGTILTDVIMDDKRVVEL